MIRAFVDTNVFLYATGSEHPLRAPCAAILRAIEAGRLQAEASVEVAQEAAHVRFRRTGSRAGAQRLGELIAASCDLHPLELADLQLGLTLFGAGDRLSPRDALFVATMRNRGLDLMLSADRDFDGIDGVERVDPASALDLID